MRGAETRRRILDAAQRLIERGGPARLTTSQIAREAGYAEGTLFKHFPRKEDLCLALVRENAPRFQEAVAARRPGSSTVAKNLEALALAAVRFSEKLIPLGVTLLADATLLDRHRKLLRKTGRGPKEAFDLLAGYIEGEKRFGRVRRGAEPLSAAALLFGPCFHFAFMKQVLGRSPFPVSDEEFAADVVATLMRGLAP